MIITVLAALPWAQGCAKRGQDLVLPGKTTEGELKAALGEPERSGPAAVRPKARLLDYSDGCSYQVERNTVVGVACSPAPEESTLQYWRHKWKGHPQRFEEIPESRNSHGSKRFQLSSGKAHMAVIYDEAIDRVVRVVKYGAR